MIHVVGDSEWSRGKSGVRNWKIHEKLRSGRENDDKNSDFFVKVKLRGSTGISRLFVIRLFVRPGYSQ